MAAAIRLSQQHSCSFDDLVGASEQCRRHINAERFRGLEVDQQLELGRSLHRQVGRLLAFKDAVDVAGSAAELVEEIGPIGHKAAGVDEKAVPVNCWQFMAGRQREDKIAVIYRCRARHRYQTAIRRAGENHDRALDLAGVSHIDRDHFHTKWTAAKLLIAKLCVASRRTATRIRLGAICLSNSNHFALRLNSNAMKPVALPPGRARLSTYPAPTGSLTTVNTTGTVRVDSSSGPTPEPPPERMTSGASAASSAECLRISVMLGVAQRVSIRRFCPMPQPNMASPCRNAPRRACHTGSSGNAGRSTPMRRMRSRCCARAASGHAAAAPSSDMNARRFV